MQLRNATFATLLLSVLPAAAEIHVRDFVPLYGMTGTAIQHAIDAAFATGEDIVICDAGTYTAVNPIYQDPPNNMRSSGITNPTQFSFSLRVIGGQGPSGCRINYTFNNQVAWWIGTGRNMVLDGVSLTAPMPSGFVSYRNQVPTTGVGVGIAGGGASMTLVRGASSNGFYTGIETSANGLDALADSNTIERANITAVVGIDFSQTNNLINHVQDSVIDALTMVKAPPWSEVLVTGGNFSSPDLQGAAFGFSGVNVVTTQQGFGQNAYAIQITGTLSGMDGYMQAGVYNAFALVTQHFGVLPLQLQTINATSGVATFIVPDPPSSFYFGGWGNDPATKTNLVAEIHAAGTIYAAQRVTVFDGLDIRAKATHVENGSVPTLLVNSNYGTAGEGGAHNTFDDIWINGDLTNSNLWPFTGGTTTGQKAQYYVARSWPQITIGYTETSFSGILMDPTDERLIVDFFNPNAKLNWHTTGPKLNLRMGNSGYPFTNNDQKFGTPAFGTGEYADNPFYGSHLLSDADMWRSPWGHGKTPMCGIRPCPWARPAITPAQLSVLQGMLPTITLPAIGAPLTIGYPLLWGGQAYSLADWFLGAQSAYQLVSGHHFYSYGQSLPISWTHLGQSAFLYVSDARALFPGLGINDNWDGTGIQPYLITGVYPQLGYVTVLKAQESANGPWLLPGIQTQIYTNPTLGQEIYAITRF